MQQWRLFVMVVAAATDSAMRTIGGGGGARPPSTPGNSPAHISMWHEIPNHNCDGSCRDLLRDFAGSKESCQAKCAELGPLCAGFVRIPEGQGYAGQGGRCYFRGGTISKPVAIGIGTGTNDGRSCFLRTRPAAEAANTGSLANDPLLLEGLMPGLRLHDAVRTCPYKRHSYNCKGDALPAYAKLHQMDF